MKDVTRAVSEEVQRERASITSPPDLHRRIMQRVSTAQRPPESIGWRRQAVLAFGIVLLVGAAALGANRLRANELAQTHATPRVSTAPTVHSSAPPSTVPTNVSPRVAFLNAQVGLIAFGDRIERTTDAGRSWSVVRTSVDVRQFVWIATQDVRAVTAEGLLASSDGGLHWRVTNREADLTAASFPSSMIGFAATASGQLLKTTDGGETFSPLHIDVPALAVAFQTPQLGWIAGPNGIEATSDGGTSWRRQAAFDFVGSLPAAGQVDVNGNSGWSIHMSDAMHGFVVFQNFGTVAHQRAVYVFYTRDGGINWLFQSAEGYFPMPTPLAVPRGSTPGDLVGVLAVTGPQSALVLSASTALEQGMFVSSTVDAGQTWHDRHIAGTSGDETAVSGGAVVMVAGEAWAIWYDGSHAYLAESLDSAQTWTTVTLD